MQSASMDLSSAAVSVSVSSPISMHCIYSKVAIGDNQTFSYRIPITRAVILSRLAMVDWNSTECC